MNPLWYVALWGPGRIRRRLDALAEAGRLEVAPTLWQVWMGVLYMWARVVWRPETIGLADEDPVRDTPRARWLQHRPIRGPFLFAARAVNPLDQVGLGSSTPHIVRHLLGAYHPGDNHLYDLAILDAEPGAMEHLRAQVAAVVDDTHPRAAFLKDLVVYEGYHARLLASVDAWIADGPGGLEHTHPDTTLPAFMAWCARQPATAAATWRAIREGRFSLLPDTGAAQ